MNRWMIAVTLSGALLLSACNQPAAEPEIMPSNVLKITAVFAPAARMPRVSRLAILKKKSPAPKALRKAP